MRYYKSSLRLNSFSYEIRGKILERADAIEKSGKKVYRLNIGNLADFKLSSSTKITREVIDKLSDAEGYTETKGLISARRSILDFMSESFHVDATVDDVFMGNGVSELIIMSCQAMFENDDEVLLPTPNYPLWSASVSLSGAKPVHYKCMEDYGWEPDISDLENKITCKTKAILIINPNNPTGAVYSKSILFKIIELAKKHSLIVLSDEIYDHILYDRASHVSAASLDSNVICLTYSGLSKNHRLAGFRSGWLVISGPIQFRLGLRDSLEKILSMRLSANVPGQMAVAPALQDFSSIAVLCSPGGRLYEQRKFCIERITQIAGINAVSPNGALYLFVNVDRNTYDYSSMDDFVYELLSEENILVVPGSAFNWEEDNHFRMTFLPEIEQLSDIFDRLERFLEARKTCIKPSTAFKAETLEQ